MAVARATTGTGMAQWLVLALAAALLAAVARVDGATATASAPAPAPSAYCTDALLSLAGCLSYVQEGSTEATPDPSCCSGLKDVVRTQVACLCQAFQSGQDFGVSLNMTKALQLPAACKVKTPPASKCNVSLPGVPSATPGAFACLVYPALLSWPLRCCSIGRSPILRPVAVVVNSFGLGVTRSGSNRERLRHSGSRPRAFWRGRQPLGIIADLLRCSNRCRDPVHVPCLVSCWALTSGSDVRDQKHIREHANPVPRCML
ncbi:hypothetical protein U9M48_006419 [Paspalum notatum var. saurae]|uniref:Bifunctional inhibitor/plant lipid transfer protein/seed storage helical domain-containing protein n=1 Tax=Paspalum notatum var. saurae TaxID=547442 RepID=A0AAQ3SG64_PASNO